MRNERGAGPAVISEVESFVRPLAVHSTETERENDSRKAAPLEIILVLVAAHRRGQERVLAQIRLSVDNVASWTRPPLAVRRSGENSRRFALVLGQRREEVPFSRFLFFSSFQISDHLALGSHARPVGGKAETE